MSQRISSKKSKLKNISSKEISELIGALIEHQSPSGKEQNAIEHTKGVMKDLGIPVIIQRVGDRSNLISNRNSGKNPNLLFCSHIDTVPSEGSGIGQKKEITQNIKGLGACDAKGSIVAMLLAFRELAMEGIEKDIALAIFVGEEETGDGGITFLREGYRPKYAIVGEPTELTMPWGQAGYVHAILNASCIPKHAFSMHGPDAMEMLLSSILKIKEKMTIMTELLPENERPYMFLQHIQGGSTNKFWYLRHDCTASIIINIHPFWNAQQFISALRRIVKKQSKDAVDASVHLSIDSWDPGFEFSSPPLRNAVSKALSLNNLPNNKTYMRSWTDAATLEWKGIKTVVIGPGSLQVAHSPNECVGLNEIDIAARVYRDSAIELLEGDKK